MERNNKLIVCFLSLVSILVSCTKKSDHSSYEFKKNLNYHYQIYQNLNKKDKLDSLYLLRKRVVKKHNNKDTNKVNYLKTILEKRPLYRCRCKVRKDTIVVLLFFGGVMNVDYLAIKVFQDKFKLWLHYANDVMSYNYTTLGQSLILSKQLYGANEDVIGFVKYRGKTNFETGDLLKDDFFSELEGGFRCKLENWDSFIIMKQGERWDNVF